MGFNTPAVIRELVRKLLVDAVNNTFHEEAISIPVGPITWELDENPNKPGKVFTGRVV